MRGGGAYRAFIGRTLTATLTAVSADMPAGCRSLDLDVPSSGRYGRSAHPPLLGRVSEFSNRAPRHLVLGTRRIGPVRSVQSRGHAGKCRFSRGWAAIPPSAIPFRPPAAAANRGTAPLRHCVRNVCLLRTLCSRVNKFRFFFIYPCFVPAKGESAEKKKAGYYHSRCFFSANGLCPCFRGAAGF